MTVWNRRPRGLVLSMITCIQIEYFMPNFTLLIMYYHVKIACYHVHTRKHAHTCTHTHLHTRTLCNTWRSHMSLCGAFFLLFFAFSTSSATSARENKKYYFNKFKSNKFILNKKIQKNSKKSLKIKKFISF